MAEIVVKLANGELAGKTAQDIAKAVNGAALAMKKAEIGTADWVKASKKFEDVKKLQGDLKKQIEGTANASDMLKKAWNGLPGSQFFNSIGSSFQSLKGGVGGLVSQFGVLKTAIAATGIGALVLVIGSLVSWFTKTDDGATKLDGILRAIGNTVDVLMNRLINLKESLMTLFTNPGKFFRGLVTDIKEGIELGQELAVTFDNLDQARRDMELADAKNQNKLNELLKQSQNVGLSYQERLDKLKEADAIELENYQQKLKYASDFAAAIDKETQNQIKQGKISDTQLDKQNEAQIKLLAVEGERIAVEEKINNRRSQLLEKRQAEEEKALAKKEKDQADSDKRLQDTEDKKAALLEAKRQKEIDDEKAHKEKLYNDKVKAAELDLVTDQNNLNEQYLAKELSEQAFLDGSSSRLIEYHNKRLEILSEQFGKESTEYQNEYAKLLALQTAAGEASIEVTQWLATDGGKALLGSLSTFGNAFSQIASMHEQGTASWKTFAIAAATISAIQGSINAYASTSAIPVVGPILAPIAAGVALAAGMFNVKKIKSIKQPAPTKKMATGGLLTGPSHAGGGIPIEAEGGEFVFSRRATSLIGANALASLNNRYTFANGGSVPMPSSPYSSPTFSKTNEKSGGILHSNLYPRVDKLEEFAYDISDWAKNLKVTNNLQDTNKGLNVLNKLKEEADV
jgi:hypothetical protein